jgi:hypothetical protein
VTFGAAVKVASAVVARPSLWGTALRMWARTTPRDWWRRRPFLPLPPADYVHFRLVTQYGAANAPVVAEDVLNYLTWCKRQGQAG